MVYKSVCIFRLALGFVEHSCFSVLIFSCSSYFAYVTVFKFTKQGRDIHKMVFLSTLKKLISLFSEGVYVSFASDPLWPMNVRCNSYIYIHFFLPLVEKLSRQSH